MPEDYKNKIIEMVSRLENEDYIFKIYHYVIVKYRKEQEGKK